ncbi:MAG: 5'/3'-nucleotidase SurE [Deltaproteobacteria bacterium]|nr:MAG: 5'/3'-nucleotidase SurE [Deltaproteobacteria bacterium]
MKKPLILVSNDDGIHSEGLIILARRLKQVGRVVVVAPDRERSAVSHSLTLQRPLRIERIKPGFYAVDGTPTDCVNLAINRFLREKPSLVVSGINKGGNLGDDITYSGTVSAAIEGTILGVPSFAVSLVSRNDYRFEVAAKVAVALASEIISRGLPKDTLLNVNVPNVPEEEIKGVKFTRQGKRIYSDAVIEKTDPRGKKYYWIAGEEIGYERIRGSDIVAVRNNYISITPLHLDMTNYRSLRQLKKWEGELFEVIKSNGWRS